MHFYIDETGQTGQQLFDPDQKTLYYGLLSCEHDIDAVAEQRFAEMRAKLSVDEIHATKLGNGKLLKILPDLLDLQRSLDFSFSVNSIYKPEHAASDFFGVVFDSRRNPAVPSCIWNSVDRIALRDCLVALLFTETISGASWAARLNSDGLNSDAGFKQVCADLIARLHMVPYNGLRKIYHDALSWASTNSTEIAYPVQTHEHRLDVMPNMICFQLILYRIAEIVAATKVQPRRIVVDEQLQFNTAQRKLTEFYASARARDFDWGHFPELGTIDFKNMPNIPLEFCKRSCGLELVDIYLWLYRRTKEGMHVASPLMQLLEIKPITVHRISIQGTRDRWASYFESGKSALLRELARERKPKKHTPPTVTFNILGRSF